MQEYHNLPIEEKQKIRREANHIWLYEYMRWLKHIKYDRSQLPEHFFVTDPYEY